MKKILVLLSTVFLSVQVQAAVISGGNILPNTPILSEDGLTNSQQEAFDEAQGVTLTSDLVFNGGIIAQGTKVDSHIVFFNTVGTAYAFSTKSWIFDGIILGILIDRDGVDMTATDSLFANGNYFTDAGGSGFKYQGLENNDSYYINGMQLDITMHVYEPGDWIRVITASPVPVPAAIWLFGFALFGLMGIRRKSVQ